MADTALDETEAHASEAAPNMSVARAWASSTLVAFQFPVFRIVWLGSILAFLAFNTASAAQSVVAYDLTGNNRAVGIVMFGQGVSMIVLNPIGGAIADRFDKRLLIIVAQSVIGGIIFVTAVLLALDRLTIWWLAGGSFGTGAMFSFLGPTRTSLLAEVVSPARVGNAMALLQVGSNVGRIAAPACAGALLSWSLLGATGTYFIISALFLVIIFTMSQIPASPPASRGRRSLLEDVRIGYSYVRRHKRLLHSVLSFYAVTALGFSYWVVMPGFVKDELHAGTAGYGFILSISAAGGLLGSLIVASLADSARARLYLKGASLVVVVSLVLVGFAPNFAAATLIMIFGAGGIAAFQTLNNAVALRQADAGYFGRVAGLLQIAWAMINILSLPTGFVADILSERFVLTAGGVALGVVVLLLYLWERSLDAADRRLPAAA
ncbi:MAG TPA: MFS transporter [Dehalococcoidia bacterium]|nr:MFS transporter [Dehalococcoidia bacterium]